jgi:RNA polymerase sigma factor (sigma-70 family)
VTRSLRTTLDRIRRLAAAPQGCIAEDEELLRRFLERRDEAAFEVLVRRHGPMVLGVCRRLLRHEHDADDAFQAAFLVLVRRAGSLGRRDLLGAWLYAVAVRTARKARAVRARRRQETLLDVAMPEVTPEADWQDLRPVLDQEIERLPELYRVPVVLCYLQGRTYEQAAQELGCPKGTVATRLGRARERLQTALTRRGLAPAAGCLTVLLARNAAPAVPAPLVTGTVRTAVRFAAGSTAAAGKLPAQVVLLTDEVLRAMIRTKAKATVVLALTLALLGWTAALAHSLLLLPRADASDDGGAKKQAEGPAATVQDRPENLRDLRGTVWHRLLGGDLATVEVATALYEGPGNSGFYTAVRITNTTRRTVGVALRNRSDAIYLNQWGGQDTPRREVVDERRVIYSPLDDNDRAQLRADFRAGTLTRLRPGASLVYWCAFANNHGRKEVEANGGKYLFLSMNGHILLTDGERVEQLRCDDAGSADVIIERPVPWKTIPAKGRILGGRGS